MKKTKKTIVAVSFKELQKYIDLLESGKLDKEIKAVAQASYDTKEGVIDMVTQHILEIYRWLYKPNDTRSKIEQMQTFLHYAKSRYTSQNIYTFLNTTLDEVEKELTSEPYVKRCLDIVLKPYRAQYIAIKQDNDENDQRMEENIKGIEEKETEEYKKCISKAIIYGTQKSFEELVEKGKDNDPKTATEAIKESIFQQTLKMRLKEHRTINEKIAKLFQTMFSM